ncbi:MAG: LLM class F420-dependent oxidoreductase [Actinomycetia bacterium]|nr:LLM class F420-dependent oxidoreductase [Actinomycetes bacterium]MCP3913346.1 LLM class F420-dependent oxidoreductase [Actinomycetes bacterium]MCP4085194.1 LLM class F420-dependent oxidoreductase [Actinomycetes bacterium]
MSHGIDIGTFGVWTSLLDLHPTGQVREVVAELDDMGWGALWRPESSGRDPLVSAALWLDACPRMAVATGIAQTYARHPLTTMAAGRTLDEAFPGRFLLGLGVSHAPMVEGVRGLDYSTPLRDMEEHLDAMDAAPFTGFGPDGRPPRILAALGPKMLALSATKADGAHPYFATPEHTAQAREIIGPDKFLAPEHMVLLETDPDRARRVARDNMARYLALPNYANNLKRLGFTDDDISSVSDRLVDAIVLWGDLDSIVARVREHLDAGADHVCVQALVEDPADLPLDNWRRLAEALL